MCNCLGPVVATTASVEPQVLLLAPQEFLELLLRSQSSFPRGVCGVVGGAGGRASGGGIAGEEGGRMARGGRGADWSGGGARRISKSAPRWSECCCFFLLFVRTVLYVKVAAC